MALSQFSNSTTSSMSAKSFTLYIESTTKDVESLYTVVDNESFSPARVHNGNAANNEIIKYLFIVYKVRKIPLLFVLCFTNIGI